MARIDFSEFATVRELRELIKEVEGEIERRREVERERFLAQLDEKAGEYGVKPEYFYRRPRAKNKSRATATKKQYRNPDNPNEIYSPGRGVSQPEWFKQKLGSGVSRDSMEVEGEE
jgi:hypothetical protein